MPRLGKIARKGAIDVAVRTPSGEPINDPGLVVDLQQVKGRKTKTLGSAAVAAGVAHVPYTAPGSFAGRKMKIVAVAHGSGWQTTKSATRKVKVKGHHR